jgi:DNA topoisomerase III
MSAGSPWASISSTSRALHFNARRALREPVSAKNRTDLSHGLYPTPPATQGNEPAKLKAIAAALRTFDEVILATDCDLGYRSRVRRALLTAQDPKTLQKAFARLKPNVELRPLYEAAVARLLADQIFNLSLTRTATKTFLAPGVRGVIGIGRVKTPTLAIVCLRDLEIHNFRF